MFSQCLGTVFGSALYCAARTVVRGALFSAHLSFDRLFSGAQPWGKLALGHLSLEQMSGVKGLGVQGCIELYMFARLSSGDLSSSTTGHLSSRQ